MSGLEVSDGNSHYFEGLAKIKFGNAVSCESSYRDENPAYVVMVQMLGGSSISVRRAVSDDRAQKLFTRELDHFSLGYTNILIIDVTNVPDGIVGWLLLFSDVFNLLEIVGLEQS